jgi:aryl-alcohol dehydrogenase-like predicted oxidoreductase
MDKRMLGKTGLSVSPLGFGAAELGFLRVEQRECDRILNGVLDSGITLIDTAGCYVDSEQKIGIAIAHRRDEFVLATKCGHKVDESMARDWTGQIVRDGVARSLRRLNTDHVDILHLHSCGRAELDREELIGALIECKRKGQTRFIGYSGDAEAAEHAVHMGVFDCLETSVSIADQQAIKTYLPRARRINLGVTAKRSIANACWRDLSQVNPFYAQYARPYVLRLQKMGITPESLGFDGPWIELALRFVAFEPHVDCAIVGGRSLEHIRENVRMVGKGALPAKVVRAIRDAWLKNDDGSWKGET